MERLDDRGRAFTEVVLSIFRANGALLEFGDGISRPVGLTSSRWQVLGVVDHGSASVAQVARTMGLSRQGVQRTADILAVEGLIRYLENPHHKRAKLMEITSKGKEALDYVEERQAKWANRIGGGHTLEELQTTLRVLEQLVEETVREEP